MNKEDIYAQVSVEIEEGNIYQGLWAEAFSKSEGDLQRTKAKYIELRVNSIIRQFNEQKNHERAKKLRNFFTPNSQPPPAVSKFDEKEGLMTEKAKESVRRFFKW
jgi:hypothetical protein